MAKRKGKGLVGVVLVGALASVGVWVWQQSGFEVDALFPKYGMPLRGEADSTGAETGDDLTGDEVLPKREDEGDLAEDAKTDTEEVVVGVEYTPGELTKGDVTAKLTGLPEGASITNNGGNDTFVFSENGKFTFRYVIDGVEGQMVAQVNWIDKAAPKVEVKYDTTEETDGPVVAHLVSVSEGEEGELSTSEVEDFEPIANAKYDAAGLQYGEEFTVTNNGGSTEYTFEKNDEFTFEYQDAAGNEGTITAKVDWIREGASDQQPGADDEDDGNDDGDGDGTSGSDDTGDDDGGDDDSGNTGDDSGDDETNDTPGGSTETREDSNWMNAGGANADDGQGMGMAGNEGMTWIWSNWGANASADSGEGEVQTGDYSTGAMGTEVADNGSAGGEVQVETSSLPSGVKVENKKLTLNSTLRQKFGANSEYFELSFVNENGEEAAERPEDVKFTIANGKKLAGVYRVSSDGTAEAVEYEKVSDTQILIKNPEAGKYLLDYEEVVNDSEIPEDALVGPTADKKPWYETQALWWVVGGVVAVIVLGLAAKAIAGRKTREEE